VLGRGGLRSGAAVNRVVARSGSYEGPESRLNVRPAGVGLGLVEHQQEEESYLRPQLCLPSKVVGTLPFYFILPSCSP
jgi:hypothetical protein